MGHDVCAVSNHSLNTSSIITLAQDLSDRFDITVQYGYVDDLEIEGISKGDFKDVQLGVIEKAGTALWHLNDCFYLDRIKTPEAHAHKIAYSFYDTANFDDSNIWLHKHTFQPNTSFSSRWWNFCKQVHSDLKNSSELYFYRSAVMKITKKLGGNAAIYIDDQGPSATVFDIEEYATFNEMHQMLQKSFGDDYLYLSQFLETNTNNISEDSIRYYLAYYDDFIGL